MNKPNTASKPMRSLQIALVISFTSMLLLFLIPCVIYLVKLLAFPYDWEPTDGDHLNFAHRIARGLPIYMNLADGNLLSIYNPLYHSIVAVLGGADGGFIVARGVSIAFFLLIPSTMFLYARPKYGIYVALLGAASVLSPPAPSMLFESVNVNPNSTMICLFLWSIICAEACVARTDCRWWQWMLSGILPAACFLAKQQGAIATVCIVAFYLLRKTHFRSLLIFLAGFILCFVPIWIYFEIQNSGRFIETTLFDVSEILRSDKLLARSRLVGFFCRDAMVFSACALTSLWRSRGRPNVLSIWEVSILLHLPFLYAILGNNGGGDSYFYTTWVSIVGCCLALVKALKNDCMDPVSALFVRIVTPLAIFAMIPWGVSKPRHLLPLLCTFVIALALSSRKFQKRWSLSGTHFVLFALCLTMSLGLSKYRSAYVTSSLLNQSLREVMSGYYAAVHELVEERSHLEVFALRNVGALVTQGVQVDNEGCTYFYAWENSTKFNKDALFERVREKRYQIISSGFSEFPEEVQKAIDENYRIAFVRPVNTIYGQLGKAVVYVPK